MRDSWGKEEKPSLFSRFRTFITLPFSKQSNPEKPKLDSNHNNEFKKKKYNDLNNHLPAIKDQNFESEPLSKPKSLNQTSNLPNEEEPLHYSTLESERSRLPLIFSKTKSRPHYNPPKLEKRSNLDRIEKLRLESTEKVEKRDPIEKAYIFKSPEVKYVGLKNQGATCYLNSILQSLFHLPYFRKFIFDVPFDLITQNSKDSQNSEQSNNFEIQINSDKNIIFSLQKLFAQLQTSQKAVSTQNLTRSFGWSQEQVYMQQDAAEFCIQLLDYIQSKLKNTVYSKIFDDMFKTVTKTFYRGVNVNFEESSEDNFFLLSAVVKNFSELNESLRSMTSKQHLEGKNKYYSQRYGEQDVILETKFVKFPKILLVHLKRFEYNPDTNRNRKINSILMFDKELNLSNLLVSKKSENEAEFELHSVIVHSGDADGGHYYVFIRPGRSNRWYKFNDSSVTLVDENEAIENNFGGPDLNENQSTSFFSKRIFGSFGSSERSFSAYMLVYVRKDSLGEIFCDLENEKIDRFLVQNDEDEYDMLNQIQINIVDDRCLAKNALKGRLSFNISKKNTITVFVSKYWSLRELYRTVSKKLEISEEHFNLYKFNDDCLVDEIERFDNEKIISSLRDDNFLYCSILPSNNNRIISDSQNEYYKVVFIFLYIKALKHPLRYLTKLIVNNESKVFETLKNQMKIELSNVKMINFSVFVKIVSVLNLIEDKQARFEDFDSSMFVIEISEPTEISDIIYEKKFLNDDDVKYSNKSFNYFDTIEEMPKSVTEYFEHINDISTIEVKTIEHYESPVKIKYSNMCSFGNFFNFIKKVVHASDDQQIFIYNSYEVLPIQHVDMQQCVYKMLTKTDYLIVNVSNEDESNIALLEVIYSKDSIKQNKPIPVLLRKEMNVSQVLSQLESSVIGNKSMRKNIRLLQINKKDSSLVRGIVRVLNDDEIVSNLRNPIRVEPIPDDQINVPPDKLIPVWFYNRNNKESIYFLLTVIEKEPFDETKFRIQTILNKSDGLMDQMSFNLFLNNDKYLLTDHTIISNLLVPNSQIRMIQMKKENNDIKFYN